MVRIDIDAGRSSFLHLFIAYLSLQWRFLLSLSHTTPQTSFFTFPHNQQTIPWIKRPLLLPPRPKSSRIGRIVKISRIIWCTPRIYQCRVKPIAIWYRHCNDAIPTRRIRPNSWVEYHRQRNVWCRSGVCFVSNGSSIIARHESSETVVGSSQEMVHDETYRRILEYVLS